MRAARSWLVLFIVLILAPSACAEWDTYQNDPAHTGYVTGSFDVSHAALLWSTPLAQGALTGLAVGGNGVYVTDQQTNIPGFNALNQATGAVVWNQTFANNFSTSAPTYSNGIVYFQTDGHSAIYGNYLRAYDAATGN